jgi:hypothetical protein
VEARVILSRWIKPLSLSGFSMLLVSSAFAGGVPTVDWKTILLDGRLQSEETLKTQEYVREVEERDRQEKLYQEQIKQLETTLALLTGTSEMVGSLDAMPDLEATEVYAIEDNNPYAGRLFGDAQTTIEQMIINTAQRYSSHPALAKAGINPTEFRCWFQALVKQESRFSIGARSNKAAFGLTQIIPGTAKDLGIYPAYYDDPQLQLDGGARYLLAQLNRFGRMELALAAYNAGPGAVIDYGGIPPFKETQDYVVRISAFYNVYASQITGVDMAGTLTPDELMIAQTSNISDAGMHYANFSAQQLTQSLTRVRGILQQIPHTRSVKEAMDLNTYMRAELVRMSAVLVRLKAARRKVEAQQYAMIWAALAQDEKFIRLTEE